MLRFLLLGLLLLLPWSTSLAGPAPEVRPSVSVGAIRWDAWHGDASDIGRAVQRSLAPSQWRWRLPFFATVNSNGSVTIPGDTDAIMSREIGYAKAAGIDYWAFVAYDPESAMSRGLRRYLQSPERHQVNFCVIWDAAHWRPDRQAADVKRFTELMALPNYQTVLNARPLFYVLNLASDPMANAPGGHVAFKGAIDALRSAARLRGLADPYCVVMAPWPDQGKAFSGATGCDAISAYAVQAGGKAAPFAELTSTVESFWKRSALTGAKVVPLAMTGWDRRPRVETPVFWEHNEGWGADIERFYQAPTPEQIAGHVRKAIEWAHTNPAAAEAKTIIIYAWNEHDEGGWLCPTLGEGDARVRALGTLLSPAKTR
jgi:hypothetical protein